MQPAHPPTLSELLTDVRGEPLGQTEHAYLLVDGARVGKHSDMFAKRPFSTWTCLFDASPGSPLFDVSPALIRMEEDDKPALRMLTDTTYRQSSQLLLSTLPLETLAEQLASHLYVEEADGTRWVLAFWDPFVMASLIGIQPPLNSLVPGPILDSSQWAGLLQGIESIVFQNRDGELRHHEVLPLPPVAKAPIKLTQPQMDMLIDLDLPDRVAALLRKAEPNPPIRDADCHHLCCAAIVETRSRNKHGLSDYCDIALDMLAALGNRKEWKA